MQNHTLRRALRMAPVLLLLFFSILRNSALGESEAFTTALTGRFPPFSYYDHNGELAGFDVDVSREIGRRLGRETQIIATEWDGILAGLLGGMYDTIIGSMAITPERAESVNFSSPYYRSGAQLFIHRENPNQVYGIDECDGLRIGVVLGETYQRFLETEHPEIQVVTFTSTSEIFEMLERHRLTGFVSDRLVGAYQIRQSGKPFVPVGEMLYEEDIAIPTRQEDTALLRQINQALSEMRREGFFQDLHQRYFGLSDMDGGVAREGASMGRSVIARMLLSGFGLTLGIALASLVLGFLLAVPCGLLLNTSQGAWRVPFFFARTFVDFLRGTPVLIQLLFVWYGLGLEPIVAAVVTLGVNCMAYMAEVVRSGLMGVDRGQVLAAQALGLSRSQTFFHVVWPQAFRIAIPPLMNSVVALTKDTALVSVITIPEVLAQAKAIISVTYQPRLYYFLVAVMFFVVTFPLMKMAGALETRIKRKGFVSD